MASTRASSGNVTSTQGSSSEPTWLLWNPLRLEVCDRTGFGRY